MPAFKLILLTGVTGYIGGRLLPLLAADGWRVRCLARQPENLLPRVPDAVEVVRGDLLDAESLRYALAGVEAAFYLVHLMGATGSFEEQDRQAAENFGTAARAAGVKRIIYLCDLGEEDQELSAHLRSRHEVGERLRASGVPVIEFRAYIIIGSGSLSFEMIRALVERLPVMVMPRWVRVMAQPLAVSDVLAYLRAALSLEISGSVTIEIGGPDRVSYGELMREYARQRGLRRLMIPVPLLTPRLSSLWLGLVTPLCARVGRKLVDSLRHPTIVRDDCRTPPFFHPAVGRARGDCSGVAKRRLRLRPDTLVGRDFRRRQRAPSMGRHTIWKQAGRLAIRTGRRDARQGFRHGGKHRWRDRLALLELALDFARLAGLGHGRSRHAAGTSRSAAVAGGRHAGLLARGIQPTRPAAASGCRNETPWPGVAGLRGATRR